MTQTYLLEWLDSVVTLTLNPKKNDVNQISSVQLKAISEKAAQETKLIQSQFANQVFSLTKEKQIRIFLENYHTALIDLLDNLIGIRDENNFKNEDLREVSSILISCLDELITFVQSKFTKYLSLDSRIPKTYLVDSQKKIRQKLDKLKNSPIYNGYDKRVVDIIYRELYFFFNSKKNKEVTFRQVFYKKQLVKELEGLRIESKGDKLYTELERLLIYMNFNSREYINNLTKSISEKINTLQTKAERIDSLHFHHKEFNQMHSHQSFILYPEHQNLKATLDNWFQQEILYLEKTMQFSENIGDLKKINQASTFEQDRVKVNLSIDQIALVLRACDESRLLESRSMSMVFKTIVPHLSTPQKKELSYDSVRSKSYNPEDRDKDVAILALEKVIKKIKSY